VRGRFGQNQVQRFAVLKVFRRAVGHFAPVFFAIFFSAFFAAALFYAPRFGFDAAPSASDFLPVGRAPPAAGFGPGFLFSTFSSEDAGICQTIPIGVSSWAAPGINPSLSHAIIVV
jgi:hypothetical protein